MIPRAIVLVSGPGGLFVGLGSGSAGTVHVACVLVCAIKLLYLSLRSLFRIAVRFCQVILELIVLTERKRGRPCLQHSSRSSDLSERPYGYSCALGLALTRVYSRSVSPRVRLFASSMRSVFDDALL